MPPRPSVRPHDRDVMHCCPHTRQQRSAITIATPDLSSFLPRLSLPDTTSADARTAALSNRSRKRRLRPLAVVHGLKTENLHRIRHGTVRVSAERDAARTVSRWSAEPSHPPRVTRELRSGRQRPALASEKKWKHALVPATDAAKLFYRFLGVLLLPLAFGLCRRTHARREVLPSSSRRHRKGARPFAPFYSPVAALRPAHRA